MKNTNPGNFSNDRKKASRAGKVGGAMSSGNFKFNRDRAVKAGRKGGLAGGENKRRKVVEAGK